jgi:rhodanese-related sulfurtransferase
MQELIEFTTNNALLVTGLIASALGVSFYELKLKARNIGSLSTAMAIKLINNGSTVIDVREAEKFSSGHIVDASNIPEKDLLQTPDVLKKHKKGTLLVCDNGVRSSEVAAELRKGGIENVYCIQGGVVAWQQDNLPVISGT